MSREMLAECTFLDDSCPSLSNLPTKYLNPSQKIKKFPATYLGIGWQVFRRSLYGSSFCKRKVMSGTLDDKAESSLYNTRFTS